MTTVYLPNAWAPTAHQLPLWRAMKPEDGLRRGICIWHRRAGKDSSAINLAAVKSHQRVGTYWHLLPTNVQARRIVWNETDRHGRRIIDQAFPPELRQSTNDGDMAIRMLNGSLYQLGGSDNYDSLVGANVRGVIFSEWALCDPEAWKYIRPILVENDGWALFIYTPRGRNHGWDLWEKNKGNEHWFSSMLTVDDTCREDGTPIITPEQVRQEVDEGMSEEGAEQEFYCSFAAGVVGAYFAREIEKARNEDRIGRVPHNKRHAVHLWFDLGLDDDTFVWVGQRVGLERRWIRTDHWRDVALQDVFREVATWAHTHDYRIATVNLPHDGSKRDQGTAIKLEQYAEDAFDHLGSLVVTHPQVDKQVQIEAGRHLITQSWFDEERCESGLNSLLNYSKTWDPKRATYLLNPHHNWASHGADAWMLAACDELDQPVVDPAELVYPRKVKVRRSMGARR